MLNLLKHSLLHHPLIPPQLSRPITPQLDHLIGAALVYAVLPFDLLLAGDFDFFPFSSDFPFLVSFFAPLAGVLEGFSGLPVFLSVDFEAFVYFAGLTSFLSEALAFLGLLASSAFNLAV